MPTTIATRYCFSRTEAGACRLSALALIAAGASLCVAAMAADANALKEIEARYQAERTLCESGRSGQDRATCLQEAASARAAAKRGQLDDAPGIYEQNALSRCEALPQEERDLCRRRTRGEGVTSGSVEGGGIYREYREIILPPAPQNR